MKVFCSTTVWVLLVGIAIQPAFAQNTNPKTLLLIGQGPDGHPKSTHEYDAGMRIVARSLRNMDQVKTVIAKADGDWNEGPQLLDKADGVVLFVSEGAKWTLAEPRRREAFTKLAQRGGALVVLHWGMGTKSADHIAGFQALFGGCHGGPDRKFQVVETDVAVVDPHHPVSKGLANFRVREEFYYRLKFPSGAKHHQPILTAQIDGQPEPVAWVWERPDGGRSFGFSGLHFHENWQRLEYRRLVSQAVLWSLRISIPEKNFPAELSEADYKLE